MTVGLTQIMDRLEDRFGKLMKRLLNIKRRNRLVEFLGLSAISRDALKFTLQQVAVGRLDAGEFC